MRSPSVLLMSIEPLRRLPALLACLLAACASVGPDYRAPRPDVPAAWQSVPVEGTRQADPQALARWWTQLADPQLAALMDEALQANPDLKSARAALRAARASRDLASARRFPTLSATGSVSRSTALGATRTLYEAGFDAAWEPDVFGGTPSRAGGCGGRTGGQPGRPARHTGEPNR